MRPLYSILLCLTLLVASCAEDDEDRQTAERAIDEASVTIQAQLITSSLADIAATTPSASNGPERADLLASGAAKLLDCGLVRAEGSAVRITFDGLGCLVRNKRLWGEVLIDVSAMPGIATLTLSDVSDGGMTLNGQSTLNMGSDPRTLTDQARLTLNQSGASTYAFLDQRSESASTTGLVVHKGSRCSALESSEYSCSVSEDNGMPTCISTEGDCRETHSDEVVLDWTKDVAQVGGLGSHRVRLSGYTREVALAYGGDESLKARLDEALSAYAGLGAGESLNSDDYFRGRCPQSDTAIVAEPGFVCVATVLWELVTQERDAASSDPMARSRASEARNYFKFWVSAH